LDNHPQWGALLDNLHVIKERKRQGIGKALMNKTAVWVNQQIPNGSYHLSVLADNAPAIAFYEKMGGKRVETTLYSIPGNQQTEIHFYLWEDCQQLI
jgi:ribosomal protein S18 acetylase RimI-like enzyme